VTNGDPERAAVAVLMAEVGEERDRKRGLEQKATVVATGSATLAASAVALGGLLHTATANFMYTTPRVICLGAIILLYALAFVTALVAINLWRYPNIPNTELRALLISATAGADAVVDKYLTYLASLGERNDRKASWVLAASVLSALGVTATLASGLLLAIKTI
jgi:hypothetical protein